MKEILTKNHPMSPNGQDSISKNDSNNLSLEEIIETRVSRRSVIKGSLALVTGGFLGLNLTGCGSSNNSVSTAAAEALLSFNPVAKMMEQTHLLNIEQETIMMECLILDLIQQEQQKI